MAENLESGLALAREYVAAKKRIETAKRTLGPLIRRERTRRGIGLRELARAMKCNPGLLSRLERRLDWSPKVVHAALKALAEAPDARS